MAKDQRTSAIAVWRLRQRGRFAGDARDTLIDTTPFRVGRRASSDLVLTGPNVSNAHAELVIGEDAVTVRDLDSMNGTYINGTRVTGSSEARDGDLLQFATTVLRLQRVYSETSDDDEPLPAGGMRAALQLDRLLTERCVVPHYQPIVQLDTLSVMGHELLARSDLDRIRMPAEMFDTATDMHLAGQLSAMLRIEGAGAIRECVGVGELFVNTWPGEIVTSEAVASLERLRTRAGNLPITVEIHECALTSAAEMQRLRDVLDELDMKMAYDDFGVGEARLAHLKAVPPDYVKFDIDLVRGLHESTPQHQTMVVTLVEMVSELGIHCVAEGVECQGAADYCRQIGFEYAQGFLFGRPLPADELI